MFSEEKLSQAEQKKVYFTIYDVINWEVNNYNTQIFSIISRSKGSQTMKFGQLIKYDMRNNFLEKPYIKPGGEASPRTFSKKSKLKIYLDQQTENYLNILKLIRGDHLLLLHIKLFFFS